MAFWQPKVGAVARFGIGVAGFWLAGVWLAGVWLASWAAGQLLLDPPNPTVETPLNWQVADHDTSYQIAKHVWDPSQRHSGTDSEHWTLLLGIGSELWLERDVTPTYVTDELRLGIWVRSNRSPLSIRARVVLPQFGERVAPLTTWVEGELPYSTPGQWQHLALGDIRHKLKRQVRVLRATHGRDVQDQGAYIDRIGVNAYAGRGMIRVWLDELSLEGNVDVPPTVRESSVELASATEPATTARPGSSNAIGLQGSLWMVHGRPFFPRIVDARDPWARDGAHGDLSWDEFSGRGWNTVWIDSAPQPNVLQVARDRELLLIGAPPADGAPLLQLRGRDPILAWWLDLPAATSATKLRERTSALRQVASESHRPILGSATPTGSAGRYIDAFVQTRGLWGTTFPLNRWPSWLQDRTRRDAIASPDLVRLDTGPALPALEQARRLGLDSATPCVSPESLRQAVRWALAAGANGIAAGVTVEPQNELTRLRALDVWELVNLELQLMDPWLAAGRPRQRVVSSQSQVEFLVLSTTHGTLAVPLLPLRDGQYVPPVWTDAGLSVVVPDGGSASIAYEVLGDRLRPLRSTHVPGGLRIELPKFSPSRLILITQEAIVVDHMSRTLAGQSAKRIGLMARLFRDQVHRMNPIVQHLQSCLSEPQVVNRWLSGAMELGVRADEYRTQGAPTESLLQYEMATAALARSSRAAWYMVTESLPQPASSPGGIVFDTLPAHVKLLELLEHAKLGPELLIGGNMDQLSDLTRGGWQHYQAFERGDQVTVSVHGEQPHDGAGCLRMSVESTPPGVDRSDTPPAWVQTPALPQHDSGLVLIHGWLRIRQPVESHEGFMIFDSIAGPSLALRYYEDQDWQEFALYRAVESGELLQVTFALTGPGQVDLDQVSITRVQP